PDRRVVPRQLPGRSTVSVVFDPAGTSRHRRARSRTDPAPIGRPARRHRPWHRRGPAVSDRGNAALGAARRGAPNGHRALPPQAASPVHARRSTRSGRPLHAAAAHRRTGAGRARSGRGDTDRRGGRSRDVGLGLDLALPCPAVVAEDLERLLAVLPADDVDGLVLERLVGREELLDLDEAVRSDLVELLDVLLMRIAERDAEHLEVVALLVAHLETADGPRPDVAAREGGLVDHQQGVRVVAVTGARFLDEAVIEVVEDRAAQDPIEPVDPGRLVELVLVARSTWDLYHDFDDIRVVAWGAHASTIPCPGSRLRRDVESDHQPVIDRADPQVLAVADDVAALLERSADDVMDRTIGDDHR